VTFIQLACTPRVILFSCLLSLYLVRGLCALCSFFSEGLIAIRSMFIRFTSGDLASTTMGYWPPVSLSVSMFLFWGSSPLSGCSLTPSDIFVASQFTFVVDFVLDFSKSGGGKGG
jgi:hypothetical protein